ncbi:16S rRNA (guanine(966)-N(2))-methyltransferase RsmD [uncultured Tateyamaria sp.]|uniref:16S rRNA (guanine(966)-N(2))-methyltransferase RsmD n=1 Tax=Tateyamaria sp. 1078 TaxID=3417464 RepID=UPI0026216135|nr:16S rRNA (guanine(966)-N(2))-methyltransferase RsmD [uncultured Tateyamaria sp.]
MRIIAGRWRGMRLAAVGKGDAGAHLRPTPDRVRESLFSMLDHRGVVEGARVLDLFAGTGALGLEALSRGAASAVLVEKGRVGQRLISENLTKLQAEEATLIRGDATRLGPCPSAPFDLVFLDPPYGQGMGERALISARPWMVPGAVVVWEEEGFQTPPDGFGPLDQRRFGGVHVTLLERLGASGVPAWDTP